MNSKSSHSIKEQIKAEALRLGFAACGFARADAVADAPALRRWLDAGHAAGMGYMHNHFDLRTDPRKLVEGARTVIVVALGYYPAERQKPDVPQFSYYAYGEDYHDVLKRKLWALMDYINKEVTPIQGRAFVDTAPLLERYWATQAGLGFIGRHTQLIIPGKGSYFFLGELVVDLELEPDVPIHTGCGTCRRCLDACPTQALEPYVLDARRCISCQTIENREEIPADVASKLGNRLYGCDTCQQVCPWNRFATPTAVAEFAPSEVFLALDRERLEAMTEEEFRTLFRKSAVKRAGYAGVMRNLRAMG